MMYMILRLCVGLLKKTWCKWGILGTRTEKQQQFVNNLDDSISIQSVA